MILHYFGNKMAKITMIFNDKLYSKLVLNDKQVFFPGLPINT